MAVRPGAAWHDDAPGDTQRISRAQDHRGGAEADRPGRETAPQGAAALLRLRAVGRYRAISQSHHTVEIGLVIRILNALAIYDWAPRIRTVSLCPNHHAYEHLLRRQKKVVPPEIAEAFRTELSEAEWERLIEMDDARLDANENVWREIREEFLRRENAAGRSGLKPGGGAADTS